MKEEHKKKISKSMIGNKNGIGNKSHLSKPLSEEHKSKLKGKTPWNKDKSISEEQKEKIRGENNGAVKYLKGKTWEEIYGPEKAKELKEKRKEHFNYLRQSATINLKGRTYEDIYGPKKAKEQKEKRRMKTKEKYANGTATFGFPTDGTMKLRRAKQICPVRDTKIELKIQYYLHLLGLEFYDHYYTSEITHAYQCDISIPVQGRIKQKTIIECDGDWWHGNPNKYPEPNQMQKEQIEEDKIRTQELIEKGFNVIRLWETQINKLDLESFAEICYGIK
jgi:G:T-mismatch repair DNA endonuclease (very short patch repair protein)